ncbi:low affinity immunoglobulin gamma Fc region receptor III-like [Acomys russatus]|uniref:low affinity immunoglobulin gamma Fc region receptor III-like n=1 Tax=Acomys russatus TaxID=60746 RepID=UPI0021E1DED8|nr:low affinity immunoglobulin gamma Fc region receptor III-like [Acomys russatus]
MTIVKGLVLMLAPASGPSLPCNTLPAALVSVPCALWTTTRTRRLPLPLLLPLEATNSKALLCPVPVPDANICALFHVVPPLARTRLSSGALSPPHHCDQASQARPGDQGGPQGPGRARDHLGPLTTQTCLAGTPVLRPCESHAACSDIRHLLSEKERWGAWGGEFAGTRAPGSVPGLSPTTRRLTSHLLIDPPPTTAANPEASGFDSPADHLSLQEPGPQPCVTTASLESRAQRASDSESVLERLLEVQMFQNAHSRSQWLLQPLTILLLFAFADRQTADLPKAVVKLEPPWIQVLKDDSVTLKCEGTHNPGNYSTQWLHNGRSIPSQVQPNYTFKATVNDSGEYQCQMEQTRLSDPVHLGVISDWLVLQTSRLMFEEGETIMLRCHSWMNKRLNKVVFYQNEKAVKFHHFNDTFSISNANHSHSGDYYCKAHLGKPAYNSKPVTITVQGPASASTIFLLWCHVAFCLVMCLLFAVDTGLYFCVRRKLQPSGEYWRKTLSVRKSEAPQDK